MSASLNPALSTPQPALTVAPAALQPRARDRCAGVGPEPGRDHPARTLRGRSCNRTMRACLYRGALLPLAHAISCALGRLGLTNSRLRRRSLPSESPVLPGQRRSGPVALQSPRLLELDPSPAPTPPTLQYTSQRACQPKFIKNYN